MNFLKDKKILLIVTGGIACYKALDLIMRLQDKGSHVECVLTSNAQEFVKLITFESLLAKKVKSNLFTLDQEKNMNHIKLANDAEIILVAPCTANFISKISYPISFFDFETFSEPIPRFKDQKPNERIPFQYSLHIQNKQNENINTKENHFEFLGDYENDPRTNIVKSMIENIPKSGSIITYYQPFEKGVIKDLSEFCPNMREELLGINERIIDLMIPFAKGGYYHPEFEGSFSIKKVLPALCKNNDELDYKNLNISNGGMASSAFRELGNKTAEEIQQIREDLLKYCWLDTYAMYAIYNKLLLIVDV